MVNEAMRRAVEDCAASKGTHLIDMLVRGKRGTTVVEVYIDAEQGVSSDLCAEVSREVADAIDRSGWIDGSYRLDVSSPGIDRPLKFPWQYRKHAGRTLTVTVRTAEGAQKKTGTLVSSDDVGIELEIGKGKQKETILFEILEEAVVKAPW